MMARIYWQTHKHNDGYMSAEKISFVTGICGASVSGTGGWLIENHLLLGSIGIIIGGVVGISGFLLQAWWIRKQYKLSKEKHRRELEKINDLHEEHF